MSSDATLTEQSDMFKPHASSATPELRRSAADHATLRERLKDIYRLSDDDEALSDTLDGESDFKEIAVRALREAKASEAMADGMAAVIEDNKARKARLQLRAERIRAAVADAMIEAGEAKITAPDMTVSVRFGKRKVEIAGEPTAEYLVQKTTFSPNKEKIAEDLANGKTLPFAYLGNAAPVITVRSR